MFNIFKKDIKIGDIVKLYLTTGKEPTGKVVEIGDNFVLIRGEDNVSNRFFDKLIGGWDVISSTASIISKMNIIETDNLIVGIDKQIDRQSIVLNAEQLLSELDQEILNSIIEANGTLLEVSENRCIGATKTIKQFIFPKHRILDHTIIQKISINQKNLKIPAVFELYHNYRGKTIVRGCISPNSIKNYITLFIELIKENKLNDASSLLNIFRTRIVRNRKLSDIILELRKINNVRNERIVSGGVQTNNKFEFKEAEKTINDLINKSQFDQALDLISRELSINQDEPKYTSNLLLKKAQLLSSLGRLDECEIAYSELISFNQKNQWPPNNLSHLYTELARLQSLRKERLKEALSTIKRALSLNPGNPIAANLMKQVEFKIIEKTQTNSNNSIESNNQLLIDVKDESNTISKLIDVDIRELNFTNPEILKNSGRPTPVIAKRLLTEAKKTRDVDLSERYPLYLEAAKAFSELNLGSYALVDYHEAAAYYSLLKGNSLYITFRKLITSGEIEVTKLTRLKDSSSSYFFEALNLLSNIDPASLLVVLANYLRINVVIHHIKRADTIDYNELFRMQFSDIFKYCLENKNIEIEQIAFKAILEFGSSSINAWNKLSDLPKGTQYLYGEFSNEIRTKRIYQIINHLNIEKVSEDLRPSEFLKNSFQLLAKQKNNFKNSFAEISTVEFAPINFRSILKIWEKLFLNCRFLNDTDGEIERDIRTIISFMQPYLNRKPTERTNLLIHANSIIQKRLSFINENTTYYGRTLFYGILLKWKKEIDYLLKEKIAQSYPSLSISVDPPFYINTNNEKSIPVLIKNEGDATSEGFYLSITLESTIYETKAATVFESKEEVSAGNQVETSIGLPNSLLRDSTAVELTINIQAIYQGTKLPIRKFQFTIEEEPSSSLTYEDIPWRDGPIPSRDLFKGRRRLVSDLAQHYLSIERDKPYILYGLTRTGKSSVLEYLRKNIEGNTFLSKGESYKIITFFWELNEAASQVNASDFYYYILYQQTYEVLERHCADMQIDVSVLKIDEKRVRFRDFKIILDFLYNNKLFPLFLVDEFSFIKNIIDKGTVDSSFLHSMRQFALSGLASFVFAGTYDIKQLIKNPRYGITGQLVNSIEYQVNEINDEAADELIEVLNDKLTFTPEAMDHIKFLSGNIPYFIQIICKHCGNYAVENTRRYIGYPELEKVVRVLIGQDQPQPNSLVKKLSEGTFQNNQFSPADPSEVAVLISSIVYFNKHETRPRGIGAHELEKMWADNKLGSYKQKLADSINLLLEKKILVQEDDEGLPVYKLAVDLFRRWWFSHHPDINLIMMTLKED